MFFRKNFYYTNPTLGLTPTIIQRLFWSALQTVSSLSLIFSYEKAGCFEKKNNIQGNLILEKSKGRFRLFLLALLEKYNIRISENQYPARFQPVGACIAFPRFFSSSK